MVRQGVAKKCFKMVEMRKMRVLFGQKTNAGRLQSIKFMVFDKDVMLRRVFGQQFAPFNMRVLRCHTKYSGHGRALLVERGVNKIGLYGGVIRRDIVGTGQRPEFAGIRAVVGVDFKKWVKAHHLGGKVFEKMDVRRCRLSGEAKLCLNRVLF